MAPRKKTTATIDATADTVEVGQLTDPAAIKLPALPDGAKLRAAVTDAEAVEQIIASIETAARAHIVGDMAVKKHRDALGSLGLKVASSKRPIIEAADEAAEPLRRKLAQIVDTKKLTEARLSALRKEITKPKVEWEEAEEARVAAIDRLIERLEQLGECSDEAGNAIGPREAKETLEAEEIDDRYGEKDGVARNALYAALHRVGQRIEADEAAAAAEEQRKREAAEHAAELEKARQEAAELAKAREKELQAAAEREAELDRVKAQLEAALAAQRAPAAPQAVEKATKAAPATLTNPANEITDPSPDELKAEHDDEGPIAESVAGDKVNLSAFVDACNDLYNLMVETPGSPTGNQIAETIIEAIIAGRIRHVRFDG